MRKYMRYMAKKKMEKAGVKHPCRHTDDSGRRTDSYFSMNWRSWVFE